MGEVYRARDTRLQRDVALKILPDVFASDPERLARFEREARLLASLNHPNIAIVHGFEEGSGIQALVMELVEGDTLADRIARGPLPFEEALPIARQIAEALEAAHEQGIVHRDLKPANVKLRSDGTVKVLDFGLAKLIEGPAKAGSYVGDRSARLQPGLTYSPTITTPAMTQIGMILGTAAYMSPEQAKGREADKRSDIWAFGCVLYEMISGRRVFAGEEVADTLAFVITKQPEWDALPATTPASIRRLLRRSLEKDRRRRLADAADLRLEIDDALAERADEIGTTAPAVVQRQTWRRSLVIIGALIIGALAAGSAMWVLRPPATATSIARFSVGIPENFQFAENGRSVLAISRDGTKFVYAANGQLYLRSLSDFQAQSVPGTQVSQVFINGPGFSPDGEWIAFVSGRPPSIRKVRVSGGSPVTVCEGCGPLGRMDWTSDGIVFGQAGRDAGVPRGFAGSRSSQPPTSVMRVSPDGGEPQVLFTVDQGIPWSAQMMPSGAVVLFTLVNLNDPASVPTIVTHSLMTGERKTLIENASGGRYVSTGHLLYTREGVLFARGFDPERLELRGEATPVVDGVRQPVFAGAEAQPPTAYFDVSDNGSLVYLPASPSTAAQRDIAILDGDSRPVPLNLQPRAYEFPRVSPNGDLLAVGTDDGREAHVWIRELAGGNAIRQLTLAGRNRFPVWSADSRYITFQSDREGDLALFRQRADGNGAAARLSKPASGVAHIPHSWSPDDSTLLVEVLDKDTRTLWQWRDGQGAMTRVGDVQLGALFSVDATFSPDGHWVAYRSTGTTATPAVVVESFPSNGSKYLLQESFHPVWSRDGQTIWVRDWTTSAFVAMPVVTQPAFAFGTPRMLPITNRNRPSRNARRNHDITRDGKILDVIAARRGDGSADTSSQINVVLHWLDEVKRLVPIE